MERPLFWISFALVVTFLFGMIIGRLTAPQPITNSTFYYGNLTPATQEYLEAHPNIVDPNR